MYKTYPRTYISKCWPGLLWFVSIALWLMVFIYQSPFNGYLHQAARLIRTDFTCDPLEPGQNPNFTTCEFRNLVLWNSSLYIVDADVNRMDVPTINVDWFNTETLQMQHIHRLEEADIPPGVPVTHIGRAVIAGFSFYHNFYHAFAEYAPAVHSLVCRKWGDCSYSKKSELVVVMANYPVVSKEHLLRPMSPTAMKCVTNHPVLHLWHPAVDHNLVVMDRVLVGFGRECRADHHHCLPWEQRRPPPRDMMQKWRSRVAHCVGFDEHRTQPVDPINILLVDRSYESGRKIINVEEVIQHLRDKYAGSAHVSLQYMDNMSMEQQARIYNNASIIIWNHGASMGNLIYAPHGAIGLQLVFMPTPQALFAWPEELVRDYPHNITLKHMVNTDPGKLLLRANWVRGGPVYKALTAREKLDVWEKKKCPTAHGESVTVECDEFWIKIAQEFELDLDFLDSHLDPIMEQLTQLKNTRKGLLQATR